tara:strand:+ start:419 stop:1747 length:1329 start_codon:yes stop_codon:yes gene_type:complete
MRLSDYTQSGGRGLFRRDRRLYVHRGTHTFTIPDGVTKIWAFVMGAGGGGANPGRQGSGMDGGMVGGGKGGGYASGIISGLTPGGTLTLTIGAGGVGAWETTAATAGANTTVVGGGTTYLQGNGGGAASNTIITSDPGSGKGQGGSASTNSVTDAYTAAGGGSYNWTAGVGYGGITASGNMNVVMGGGASGSPFGSGQPGTKCVGYTNSANGGGGWCQIDYPRDQWLRGSNGEYARGGVALGGFGSHYPPEHFSGRSRFYWMDGKNGGEGFTAKGGLTFYMNQLVTTDAYGGASTNKTFEVMDAPGMITQTKYKMHEVMHGEDGNPNWWFPWEVDGGGGGGIVCNDDSGQVWTAGTGGPGAGGGGARMTASDTANITGGRGGFGGGGGAAYNSLNDIQRLGTAWGGQGGNGGGGGSAHGRIESSRYMPIGGNGGDGAIGIYW